MPWTDLTYESLEKWVRECQAQLQPRVYRLARSVAVDSIVPFKSNLPFSIEVVEDSGTFELSFDFPRLRREAGANYLGAVADICSSLAFIIDGRRLLEVDSRRVVQAPDRRLVAYEARSRIKEERTEIEVIGPGGSVIVCEVGETLTADLTMRRRETSGFPLQWRDPNEIVERVIDELRQGPTRLRGTFGYFEDSKYELQEWMQMAFAFTIDSGQERGPHWSYSFIESATVPIDGETSDGRG